MIEFIPLDLSAACDTVDHEILYKKLQCDFGLKVNGKAKSGLTSYLTDRIFAGSS